MKINCKICRGTPIEIHLDNQAVIDLDGVMTCVWQGFCHKCGQGYFKRLLPMIEIKIANE